MSRDQMKSKVVPGPVPTCMSQPAVEEPLGGMTDVGIPHKYPPQTIDDSTEQNPSSLLTWTVQGYKVSTEEYYRNPSGSRL